MMQLVFACVFVLGLSGCASLGFGGGKPLTAEDTRRALTIGTSTREDVKEVLGSASVNSFASGYEVWSYDYKVGLPAFAGFLPVLGTLSTITAAVTHERELVILFDPAGKVRKFLMREGESKAEAMLARQAPGSPSNKGSGGATQ
ncbi:hypothetical protein [Pseudoduganella violaceinigra]|uniref:hypothetical protein n=1 Tax=Pseudoduganella violaceinigra TaxID=246602 RepID=UPI0012B66E2E|nr:hypothetical protein [Pseudoduganella violaceinigra]